MLRIINDRIAGREKFPLDKLLEVIQGIFGFQDHETVRITRVGGRGSAVLAYESVFDEGRQLLLSISDLKACASDDGQVLDLLHCIHDKVCFGISDSSFVFVQAKDKELEAMVAQHFTHVKEVSDSQLA